MILKDLPISSTALLLLAMIVICGYGWFRLDRRTKANPQNDLFYFFRNFFATLVLFSLVFVTPFLLTPHNEKFMVSGYIAAQFCFSIAMAWLAGLIARSFNRPAKWGEIPLVILGFVELAEHIIHFPTYDFAAFTAYNIQKVVPSKAGAAMIGLKAMVVVLPLLFIMIRETIKVPAARLRTSLIALGFIFFSVGGPMHDFAGPRLFAVADIVTLGGFVLILTGLLVNSSKSVSSPPVDS